ncbi:UNVERIFIED_CONTAM: hypothetical protein RMT77_012104 [Armadillidium vulgare]
MPLLILSGYPSSGKSVTAQKLSQYFTEERQKKVTIVSENEILNQDKNVIYNDSKIEKILRGNLKSTATRLLNNEELIILDGLNYIKGFRYELYCVSKHHKTPHCIVQCVTPIELARKWNESRSDKYSQETFDALVMRYEPPDSRNRWDFPMFGVLPDEPLPFENIYGALYDRKPPPPNQSTQLQPLTSNNFVHELDKCTQEVISFIMNSQKVNAEGEIKIPGVTEVLLLPRKLSLAELSRHRRQFTTYSKSHPVKEASKAKTLFIQYLNKTVE